MSTLALSEAHLYVYDAPTAAWIAILVVAVGIAAVAAIVFAVWQATRRKGPPPLPRA